MPGSIIGNDVMGGWFDGEDPQQLVPAEFSVAVFLPQFGGNITVQSVGFTVAAELPQFGGDITTVQGRLFDVSARLPQFGGSITVAHGRAFAVAAILPQFGGKVVMSHGKMFSVAARLPQFGGSIKVFTKADFSAAVTLPQFGARLVFLGAPRALSMNVFHGGVCDYANFNFNSVFIAEDGLCYGIDADGLHVIEGVDDNGVAIESFMESGALNLAAGQMIRIEDVILLARTDGDATVTLYADDDAVGDEYIESGDPSGALADVRFKPDKGVTGHTWRYRVGNVAGSTLTVQQVQMFASKLSRKVA